MRRFMLVLAAALVAAPAAAAAGPTYASQGGLGLLSADGKSRFVAVGTGTGTAVQKIAVRGGAVRGWATLEGDWGIPQPTMHPSDAEGLTRDGKSLFVTTLGASPTEIAILSTRTMQTLSRFTLDGSFAYDALSPDGRTLYLTEHVDQDNANRYVVRAFDLETEQLLPGRIADKTQRGWVMEGWALTRATSADGRWVYTLFSRPGAYPFVHALDTVDGVAHCIGLPWKSAEQGPLMNMRMTLTTDESTLALAWKSGKPWLSVDTGTWRIAHPGAGRSSSWRWLAYAAAAALLALLLAAALWARTPQAPSRLRAVFAR
jgi:hypothetical protein